VEAVLGGDAAPGAPQRADVHQPAQERQVRLKGFGQLRARSGRMPCQ
jgi:hypothetical protein